MKVLITGGAGLIGGMIIPGMRKNGHEADVYDLRLDEGDDVFAADRLTERMRRADAAVHLVAIPHPYEAEEETYRRLNYEGAVSAFECAATARVKKFVFASSGCVYGFWGGRARPEQFPILEKNRKPSLEEGQNLYGYFKLAVEKYLESRAAAAGVQSASVRIEGLGCRLVPKTFGHRYRMPLSTVVSGPLMHYLAACSQRNCDQFLDLLLRKDPGTPFEAFNLGNRFLEPGVDGAALVREHWPDVPDRRADKREALYGIEKAVRLLGYDPVS